LDKLFPEGWGGGGEKVGNHQRLTAYK